MYSSNLICDILDYINMNINKEISIDELSNMFYYNRTYIMKKFKKDLGITINNYINTIRIYNSLSLFKYDNYMESIGYKNGFNSLEYFSETFKKVIGVNPTTYKKFITYTNSATYNDEQIIRKSLTNILILKSKVENYLLNKKPDKLPVKKITL